MRNIDSCFITWHLQARSRNLAKALNIQIYELEIRGNVFLRQAASSVWTLWAILTKKPRVIYIQYSFLLLVIVAVYRIIRQGKIVVICDSHNKALRRTAPGFLNYVFWPIKKWSFAYTDIVIVSNESLVYEARALCSHVLVLPDPIPDIQLDLDISKEGTYCVFISSFAADEPVREVMEAAQLLQPDVKVFWTGRIPERLLDPSREIDNVIFTSYLDDSEYHYLIANADCLLILTTEEGCLMSGAYEGLAVGVPMVLSDTKALRQFFGAAAIYCNHNPVNISEAVRRAIKNNRRMRKKAIEIRQAKRSSFAAALEKLCSLVERYTSDLFRSARSC